MDKYLNHLSEGTTISAKYLLGTITSTAETIIEAQYSSQITKSDRELIKSAEEIVKTTDNIYEIKSVKVRKYQLYKNRGD